MCRKTNLIPTIIFFNFSDYDLIAVCRSCRVNELSLLRECFLKPKKDIADLLDNTGNK